MEDSKKIEKRLAKEGQRTIKSWKETQWKGQQKNYQTKAKPVIDRRGTRRGQGVGKGRAVRG